MSAIKKVTPDMFKPIQNLDLSVSLYCSLIGLRALHDRIFQLAWGADS